MPVSSLLPRLGSFPLGIFKRGRKSRLSVGPNWRTIELQDVFGGSDRRPPKGLPEPEVHCGDGVRPQDYQLVITVHDLLLNRSVFSPIPWPDSTNRAESVVLAAAATGRWEAIQEVFNRPGQKSVVLGCRNKCGWTLLHFAAYNGHLHTVKELIKSCKLPPDQRSKHHWTPLFLAAWGGHEEVVMYLLKHQHSAVVQDVDGRSLLHAAVWSGNMDLVEWIIEEYNPAPTVTKDGGTLLIPAAESGNTLLFNLLVSRFQLVPNQWSENGLEHPLHNAAKCGHLQLTQHLIQKYSCDMYCTTKDESTLLHCTAVGGSVDLFEWLMANYKFEVDAKSKDGRTPLMLAAAYGHLPLARLLVETYHCDVNAKDRELWTPVMFAARYNQLPVMKMLLEHGADVFHKAQGSATSLHHAALGGAFECLKYLLPHFRERMFEVDEDGRTCLHYAVLGGSLPVMRYLVDQCGFDLSLRTGVGLTPLMLTAHFGHLPLAQLLVETYHCDVNEEDSNSWTPVMHAIHSDCFPVLQLLVQHGGDVCHKAQDSATALHHAAYGGSLEYVEYLLPLFGDRKFEMDENGRTCLHYAVGGGSLPVMRYLVDQCGFDLSLKTASGQDCFLLACKLGHQEIVHELLIKDKVDQNVVDDDGRGAVHLACKGGHVQLVKVLVKEFAMSPDIRDNAGSTPIQLVPDSVLADLLTALNLEENISASQSHESVLEGVCWIPLGIESLFITPFGGVFPLVHEGGEEEGDEAVIQLHVPQGAVRSDGEGMMEVRYAVIPDGPFMMPEGYGLCSMAVYIHYTPAQATKPFYLLLPHWSGAPDHPTFVTSPHTLPEGKQYYPFRLLEGGEFCEGYGIVEVDGHCTLFGQAYKLKDTSRYYASLWEREEGHILRSKLAVTFDSSVWIRILRRHWIKWRKRFTESFQMKEDHIESSLSECSGRGWSAAVVGKNWVWPVDIEYKKKYKSNEKELQYAVEEHLYPPAISLEVVQNVAKHLRSHKRIHLHVYGAKEGMMNFPIDLFEEKEGSSVVAARQLSSESDSTERSASLTHQAPTTGGEMDAVQSRSEVAVSDRDPLSQPVHLYERYAVLFRQHVSRKGAGKGKAILEWVGLTPHEIKLCYQNNPLNEEEAIQDGLIKWMETHDGHCTWHDLLNAMKFAGIAQQDCEELAEELKEKRSKKAR